jgi:8-oxo-dGTP pyrophosphatase MutT (NUDIX family)
MPLFSETLVVVDRFSPDTGDFELLVGAQVRGPWQNWFNFPGGKRDEGESGAEAARREL